MNQVLKATIFISIFIGTCTSCFTQNAINQESTGAEILEKTYNTLHNAQRISYDYQRILNYASDDYYHELKATAYLDYQSASLTGPHPPQPALATNRVYPPTTRWLF